MHDVLISAGEFCRKTVSHWYAVGIGVIGGILGLASTLYAEAKPKAHPLVPLWIWLPLLAGGFLVAIVWAFHDVRMERDTAKDEIENRFSALRYALQREAIDYRINLAPDATWSVEVGLRLKNNSDEYLRYEIGGMNVVIEGRSVQNPQFCNGGTIIPPHGSDVFRFPFIHSVPNGWQQGSVEFTVLYGHPSAAFRYRKSQTLRLTTSRLFGKTPPHDIHIQADLVTDSEIEDVRGLVQPEQRLLVADSNADGPKTEQSSSAD